MATPENKRLPRKDLPPDARIETLAVREGLPATQWGENSEALFLTSSFNHPDAATAAARFANEEEAFVYSRFTNPTTMMFERRLAALEGTEACIATASGMSAILLLVMGLLKSGDHIVCSQSVFGSTISLLQGQFGKFGVQTTFVSQTDVQQWRDAMQPNTKLLFAETPSNPMTEVCDIAALAEIAHSAGALLAVDNCFCTPALQQPITLGADLIIHSGTKYLDGQGRVLAGAICGPDAIINGPLMTTLRGAGMTLSPFNAWVVLKGLETLSIRMAAQSANALKLAQWLELQPAIDKVYYPGLPSHPQHALAMQQQSGSGGAVLSFTLKPAAGPITVTGPQGLSDEALRLRQAAFHVIDHTRLCSITSNLGDTKTLITHPSSTSHGRLQEAQRLAAGVTQAMVRVAVGLEHIDDLTADLARGLDTLST
jgi:O-succinylhomoserine sulfhydrylase